MGKGRDALGRRRRKSTFNARTKRLPTQRVLGERQEAPGKRGGVPAQPAQARGNTKARAWVFTLFPLDPETDFKAIDSELRKYCNDTNAKRARWQAERCPNSGLLHLQGVVDWPNAKSFNSVRQGLTVVGAKPVHTERAKNVVMAGDYCHKDASRVEEGLRTSLGVWPRKTIDPLAGRTLYPWQESIKDRALNSDPDPRKIHWYVDERGASGKSTLAKHLMLQSEHTGLYITGGKASDIAFLVNVFVKNDENELRWVIFDLPRSSEGKVSYNALEQLKNGMMFSPKFESAFCMFNVPHVFVFANWHPDLQEMSDDRWDIHVINNEVRNGGNALRAPPDPPEGGRLFGWMNVG